MEKGTLVRWNSEKGFGFIKPDTANAQDVFIHISALKQMARKPVVGDQINYFSELQSDGKIKAIKANIEGVAIIAASSNRRDNKYNGQHNGQYKRKSLSGLLLPLLVVLGLGIFGFKKYEELTSTPVLTNQDVEQMQFNPVQNFSCEAGKTHCSQMRSCAEAKYYNRYCPDTKMDGDGDGIPCERQLCN
ncbi:excalibur calcium-binding domain-containing protein [Shewanella sp. Isolate11]|uniref:excalibur calcium-binding domain-containing protein n=1 Tax=Shewanella sp. Isolate11 TaxID=2908530 RepID=UPI001EFE3436|nr:excalibur calcium-binding domain-containing protein [Shewanella sp. Isolate11]MCG9695551.1 excalibur calcium-binding domain-containing protein [Shewanella sp. Isolate11]